MIDRQPVTVARKNSRKEAKKLCSVFTFHTGQLGFVEAEVAVADRCRGWEGGGETTIKSKKGEKQMLVKTVVGASVLGIDECAREPRNRALSKTHIQKKKTSFFSYREKVEGPPPQPPI